MFKNKKSNLLICVGIGKKQLTLVRKVVEAGFEVIGIDKNPYLDCQSLCIKTIKCSTYESKKVIEELRKVLKGDIPSGVIFHTSGLALITVALISEEFSLDCLSLGLAKASVEKMILFEDCKKLGILTPFSKKLNSFEDFHDEYIGMVVKPDIPTLGTNNVFKLTNKNSLKDNFERAINESVNQSLEIQEYIDGIDIGVIALINKNKRKCSVFFDQWVVLEEDKFRKVGFGIPSIINNKETQSDINSKIDILIKYWNVSSGIIVFSFRLDVNANIWLYEVNPGLVGDFITKDLLPKAYPNFFKDFYDLYLNFIKGIDFECYLEEPLPFSIFEKKLLPLEEAFKRMNSSSEFKELILRINQFDNFNSKNKSLQK